MDLSTAYIYVSCWAAFCLVALLVAIVRRAEIELFRSEYWRHILVPWKIGFFSVALAGIVVMAPYTGDPTWDYVDAAFMAILAYTTAPWAVGTLFRCLRRQSTAPATFVAVAVWMFSASWSYDGYLLLRDGEYPITWAYNIGASSSLYLFAGLFWSLQLNADGRPTFGFLEPEWPIKAAASLRRLLPYVLIIMAPVVAMFLYLLVG